MNSMSLMNASQLWFFYFKVNFQVTDHLEKTLIASNFRGEQMIQLHIQMLVSIPDFSKIPVAFKHKFNAIYKQHKNEMIANGILGNDFHKCLFLWGIG